MDGLFSPDRNMDVALGRPSLRRCVQGLPEGRPLRGVFFWLLFLHKQEKSLARSPRDLQRSTSVKTGEKAHQPFKYGGIISSVSRSHAAQIMSLMDELRSMLVLR